MEPDSRVGKASEIAARTRSLAGAESSALMVEGKTVTKQRIGNKTDLNMIYLRSKSQQGGTLGRHYYKPIGVCMDGIWNTPTLYPEKRELPLELLVAIDLRAFFLDDRTWSQLAFELSSQYVRSFSGMPDYDSDRLLVFGFHLGDR